MELSYEPITDPVAPQPITQPQPVQQQPAPGIDVNGLIVKMKEEYKVNPPIPLPEAGGVAFTNITTTMGATVSLTSRGRTATEALLNLVEAVSYAKLNLGWDVSKPQAISQPNVSFANKIPAPAQASVPTAPPVAPVARVAQATSAVTTTRAKKIVLGQTKNGNLLVSVWSAGRENESKEDFSAIFSNPNYAKSAFADVGWDVSTAPPGAYTVDYDLDWVSTTSAAGVVYKNIKKVRAHQ